MDNPKKILLVDDDQIFLTLAEMAIRKELRTVEIHKVMNGEQAIQFLQEEEVDLIFLDLNMPVMNGWEFLDAMAQEEREDNNIFILTSSIDPSDQQRARENPLVKSMLEKPLDQEKIQSVFIG